MTVGRHMFILVANLKSGQFGVQHVLFDVAEPATVSEAGDADEDEAGVGRGSSLPKDEL